MTISQESSPLAASEASNYLYAWTLLDSSLSHATIATHFSQDEIIDAAMLHRNWVAATAAPVAEAACLILIVEHAFQAAATCTPDQSLKAAQQLGITVAAHHCVISTVAMADKLAQNENGLKVGLRGG